MRVVTCGLAATFALACTSNSSQDGPRDAGMPTVEQCDITPADVYVAGIDRASADGRFHVKILDAMPAPPVVGDNTWTIQLVDAAGAPLVGKLVPVVTATNPARSLPSPRAPVVTVVDAARAVYRIEKLLLGVTGIWRVEITDGSDAGAGAHFDFCVAS